MVRDLFCVASLAFDSCSLILSDIASATGSRGLLTADNTFSFLVLATATRTFFFFVVFLATFFPFLPISLGLPALSSSTNSSSPKLTSGRDALPSITASLINVAYNMIARMASSLPGIM